MPIDAIDRRLLTLLQRDDQLTNAQLADRVGLSQSACHRRIKQMEASGVIAGHAAVVDRKKIGINLLAYVFVKMEQHAEDLLDEFARGVNAIDEVVSCHAVSGSGDYLLKVAAADMDAFADVVLKKLLRLPGVKDLSSNFVLSTIKPATGWPLHN